MDCDEGLANLENTAGASVLVIERLEVVEPDGTQGRAAQFRELFGTNRVFLATGRNGAATLMLMDGEGRRRVANEAPREGDPSIQFLDRRGSHSSASAGGDREEALSACSRRSEECSGA
jgi:hypothetical protein